MTIQEVTTLMTKATGELWTYDEPEPDSSMTLWGLYVDGDLKYALPEEEYKPISMYSIGAQELVRAILKFANEYNK